ILFSVTDLFFFYILYFYYPLLDLYFFPTRRSSDLLHQAHYVKSENVRYAGSILKYSLSEANHNKGYFIVEMDSNGVSHIEKRSLTPKRDLRALEGKIDDLLQLERSDDYVF